MLEKRRGIKITLWGKEARNIQRFLRYENVGYYLRGYYPKHQINDYIYDAKKRTFFKIKKRVGGGLKRISGST